MDYKNNSNSLYDIENQNLIDPLIPNKNKIYSNSNINKLLRLGFIKKVYGVLSMQLIITILLSSIAFNKNVKEYLCNNAGYLWISVIFSFVVIIPLICCKSIARKVPVNYILLIMFTIFESVLISYVIASVNDNQSVFISFILTTVVVIGLTIYACKTNKDFTMLGGLLLVCSVLLILLGILSIIFGGFLRTLYCVAGVFIFSVYLIYDTQLIMGRYGSEFDSEDYIVASLSLYLDIIQLFLYILELISKNK